MNIFKLIPFVFIIFLTQNLNAQLFLKGTILDRNQKKAILYEPINNIYNEQFETEKSLIQVSKTGAFNKQIKLEKAMMLCVKIGIEPIYFYAEPGDTIEMYINVNKFTNNSPDGGIVFKGRNNKGNEYFNLFAYQPGKKFADFEYFVNDSLHFRKTHNMESIDIALTKVSSTFDTLLAKNDISNGFYDLVVKGIKDMLVTREIRYLFSLQNNLELAADIAEEIYKRYPVDSNIIKGNVYGSSIAYYYYNYLNEKKNNFVKQTDSVIVKNGKNFLVKGDLVFWLSAPPEIGKIYWAKDLLILKKMFASKFGLVDIESYFANYPLSPVKDYLSSFYSKWDALEVSKENPSIKFVNDTTIRSLNDLISSHFSGKKLYVDIWASWCVPCKQEFEFNEELDSFCLKNDIQKLYISIDRPDMQDAMKRDIYSYNLKGNHFVVNQKFYENLKTLLTPEGKIFSIPRYLIINENGTIVNFNALRPSSGNELFNIMKSDLNILN